MASLDLAYYLAFGSIAGLFSGLFGIGGGVVIVPFLAWFFSAQGFEADKIMVVAVATSLATIIFTSISAVYAHHRHKAIHWPIVAKLAPGILLGASLGSLIADRLPVATFKLIYAFFLIFIAFRIWVAGNPKQSQQALKSWFLTVMGALIGLVSAILGIGGGTLTVPLLIKCNQPVRNAIAISSACGFPIAVAGTLSYIALGWHKLPGASLGYIDLNAFLGITASSVLFAPMGAKLAHKLPTQNLKKIFALLLFLIGLKMLWQA